MANTFVAIATTTVGSGGAADITFSSIPATYTDLCVLLSLRGTVSAGSDDLLLKINNDNTSSRYTTRSLTGDGAAASSATSGYTSFAYLGVADAATATASTFSNHQLYIPNYAGSNQKSYSTDTVQETNGTTAYASIHAGLYNQTTAVSSLVFLTASGNFAQYSTATLYGIKNS
jgi:hypothetical protein